MTVSQTTLARPAFGGRTAPILAAVIFVVGVVSGLLVAQLPLGILGPIATSGIASNPTWQLYNDFRSGERDVPTATFTQEQLWQAWLDFRNGERDADASR